MASAGARNVVIFSLFRLLLPIILLVGAVVRYNALSFIYLTCLLVTPLLPSPAIASMRGSTGRFLKALIALSAIPVLGHIIFHIVLVSIATDTKPYGSMFPNCSTNEILVRQIGFQRLDHVPAFQAIRIIAPDVLVLIVSIVVLVVSQVLLCRESLEEADLPYSRRRPRYRKAIISAINFLGEFFVSVLLAASSILIPSLLGSVYFISFLTMAVLWACYHTLDRRFAYFRIILLLYTGAHILLLYLYQFQFFQDAVPVENFIARLLGLTGIVYTDCKEVYKVQFYPQLRWMVFVNPCVLLALYWVLALETRSWYTTKDLPVQEWSDLSLIGRPQRRRWRKRHLKPTERQVEVSQEHDEVWWNYVPLIV